ncbi:MAG TPA: glycosyltransferase family 87 protein [Candidatus Binataceae bacterium]|nr:glycosyltransferase family 87 protein [Candidatus Binataceae bacterium]
MRGRLKPRDSDSDRPSGPIERQGPRDRLAWYEVAGITAFFLLAVLFGVWVEIHSAFLRVRRTDLADFLRAGWAVRIGSDLYAVTEDHGWHYNFPPLFAIVMAPLADPPKGADRAGMVPFPLSVAIWYLLSLISLGFASDILARTLEQTAAKNQMRRAPPSRRQWWRLRLLPVIVCIAPIGFTLSRGQVNLLLLLLLCAMLAAIAARRPIWAGVWLAAAACIKIFPLYLLMYPLWRRDWRFVAGCAAALLTGLILIPAAVFGTHRTVTYYAELNRAVLEPAMIGGSDRSRATELIDPSATDSQSFQTIIHNTIHWREIISVKRRMRSTYISPWVRAAHWGIVAGLTLITLAIAGPRGGGDPFKEVALGATLMIVMLLASPVCHLHYFAMAMPLVAVLLVAGEQDRAGYFGGRYAWLLGAYLVLNSLPLLPGLEILHDLGIGTYAALALWLAGIQVLASRRGLSDTPVSIGVAAALP